MIEYFSPWTFIRASGFLAYFFMTISIAFGLISTLSIMKKKKSSLLSIHQTSGWYGLLTIFFHMLLLWRDQFVPYSMGEILIPFAAKFHPVFSAFGTVSFYLFFISIGTSDFFIGKLGRERWKKIHLSVIPAWILMVVHGISSGTDSSEAWALFIYASGISAVSVLVLIRYFDFRTSKQKRVTAGR